MTKKELTLKIVHPHAAGIDVGSRSHFVAVDQNPEHVMEFGVYTRDHLLLIEHLKKFEITTVAMESTGSYWQTLFNALQAAGIDVYLVNGSQTKNVKGRKTDVIDCMWIQKLHSLGLLSGSFLLNDYVQQLRTYYSHRQHLLEQASKYISKMQAVMRMMNIRLDIILRDTTGKSGIAVIQAILDGERDPVMLSSLVSKGVKKNRDEIVASLQGQWRDDFIFELRSCLSLYYIYEKAILECDAKLENELSAKAPPLDNKVNLAQTKKKPLKHSPKFNIQQVSFAFFRTDLYQIPGVSHTTVLCEKFDYEELKRKTLEQLRSGKSLFGKDGAFAPLLKDILEAALQGEMEGHLDEEQRASGNRKNGKISKKLRTADGTIDLETPRDRSATFEPQIVKKRETILAESLENKIIGMYSHGMSFRDISAHIKDMYDTDISATTLSSITDNVIPLVKEWQARPLEPLYCIVWLDAMFYKVKEEGKVVSRCVYNILGINAEGGKDLLGTYVSESEGANFWLGVLTNLQQRGVEDILIACIDGLKGFAEAIASIYPATEVQACIVLQVRNSIKYVTSKDQKAFMADLKPVYQAVSKDEAEHQLEQLEEKWGKKYPIVIDSWRRNWDKLSNYFQYSEASVS